MLCTSLLFHIFVNLPLLVLTLYFNWLWPLALATVAFSLSVCLVAAAQAYVPREKRRWWSRPVIAAMFLLQPIARGWHRLKVRLNFELAPPPQQLMVPAHDAPDTIVFWSAGHADRYRFLDAIQNQVAAQSRPARLDTGWERFDLEVQASAWNRIQLTTVTEELDQGRRNFRCRLDATWSARSKLLLALLIAFVAFVISMFRESLPWIWMTLVLLPLAIWFVEEDRLIRQAAFAALLESAAAEQGLISVKPAKSVSRRDTSSAAAQPQGALAES